MQFKSSSRLSVALLVLLSMAGVSSAASGVQVLRAELSIPFGVVPGKLLLVKEYLVFVDDEKSESSFAVSRKEMRGLTSEGELAVVETLQPVWDRSGERSRLPFRVGEESAALLSAWFKSAETPAALPSKAGESKVSESNSDKVYEAEHIHFPFGNCRGRVLVSASQLAFESLTEVSHSRQWPFLDIKQLDRKGPYELEVERFAGGNYKLKLRGQGMDIEDYKKLGDRIAAARSTRK